ncbi:BTB/POZ domain-containing protein 9 [Habropoda laboriosa]|uniref:BTB/POZ domain-containing protein 9 n=1 Tax=Habropoda laboriosa TaxID=597456 RepID=A0A0L7QNJ3_9HYME|nr:PREDICTED: BTB/POZ domain-containing protein 9-like [Habropoda laboriosa]KOC60139.1 BTB/POZ domain-containing protein 9 [Habropoda laboriosa]
MSSYSSHVVGDINHISTFSDNIGALYFSNDYSDVTLIVNGQRFNSHKIILAARSQYFRALLFGDSKESTQCEIKLKDANLDGFKGVLEYIYTGQISLTNQRKEVILDILRLAHLYGFSELEDSISNYFRQILDVENVCLIFNAALLYQQEFLTKVCRIYLGVHTYNIIRHESFLHLSAGALNELVSKDSFYAPEIDIFLALQAWIKVNPNADGQNVLDKVRLSLISTMDLLNVVQPTGLVSPEAILSAIAARTQLHDSDLNYCRLIDTNITRPIHGAQVLQGEIHNFLLHKDTTSYLWDMKQGYIKHTITKSQEHGIVVKLGIQSIINHVKMLLWDCMCFCSYYTEVSMEQKNWIQIIDHTEYFCHSWQVLYFEPRVVVYIRIVGTNASVPNISRVKSLSHYY